MGAVEAPAAIRRGLQVQPAPEKSTLAGAPASDDIVALEPGRLTPTPVTPAVVGFSCCFAGPIAPVIAVSRPSAYAARVGRGPQAAWLGLAIAQHGAATFDAWSTRRAITQGGAQELNPMLKPFAGNRSIYAAVQVGPALLDYLGRRMMTSRHGLLRHTWWLPQALGTAASLASGVHNLGVR